MSLEEFIAQIARNNQGESSAIEGYFMLLSSIKRLGLPQELYNDIVEIISDELNHENKLQGWITRLSSIQPAKD